MTASSATTTSSASGYQLPSPILQRLFLPPKDPSLTLSPKYDWLIACQEPPLPPIELFAKKEEKLAGLRLDPELLTVSRLDWATSLSIQRLIVGDGGDGGDGGAASNAANASNINLPDNSEGIRYIQFHPSKPLFVFTSKVRGENTLELYKCEYGDGEWKISHIPLIDKNGNQRRMNFVNGCAYKFTSEGEDQDKTSSSKLIIKVVPQNHPPSPPTEETKTIRPAIQEVKKGANKAPGRTYQDLLKNKHDEEKFRYYMTVELLCLDDFSGEKEISMNIVPQSQGGILLQSFQSSPDGQFLLVQIMTELSYSVPLSRFGKDVQLWPLHGSNREDLGVINVASLPIDDEIPLSYDACSRHPRKFQFHPCLNSTLVYIQALDGGDPEKEGVDGERDVVYTRSLEKGTTDGVDGGWALGEPKKLLGLEWRYSDLDFAESGLAIVEEYRWKDRMERKWILELENDGEQRKKRMLWERSWEDRYTAPGEPMTRRGKGGQYFVVQPTPTSIYLEGPGASDLGDRPFLDLLDFSSEEETKTTRLWRCTAPVEGELDPTKEVNGVTPPAEERKDIYETFVCLFPDNETIMISRESKTTPRNYYLSKLSSSTSEIAVTEFEHPQPDLLGITKELVKYQRKDGVQLTANLYLPPNYDNTPRPTLFWAYPREFKSSQSAGQVKGSKHKFITASWASPIHWAAKGWAIMDDFALPVIGEGDAQPNDTFIEQIVMGATAAVEYATDRGVCDPKRCAVGGHSYGSFMTSHLLSHTSLFAAGIGRSGAFNRTLTPMSFQSEDRSLWEAPDTYITMSPLMHVKKYSEQERVGKLLLIHGEEDQNSGTFPMQSERYFAALKAFGIESRLVMLPLERHGYRARESILHMAWEQEEWLKSLESPSE